MEPNLFKYIWQHSKRDQLFILVLVLLSLPFYFVSLQLPKQIVNDGIEGKGFAGPGSTQDFMTLNMPFGETLFGRPVTLFEGFELEQMALLFALSFAFLMLVIVNGTFKFVINTLKGQLGERMLRRLRYELTDRVLRFRLAHFKKVRQAEVATMVKDEVEPLGGFIGDAFMTPVFLGGQALTAMAFILLQNVWLGSVAAVIVVVQAILIPKLRVRILELGRQRQLVSRRLAGRIGEVVAGATEIHAHDTSNFERAEIAHRLGTIYRIRYEIFRRKFFVKFLNNFLSQLTPFIFYAVGGYLVIVGQLNIGALVAVIAAYKDLPAPIKELIDWDQQRNDVQIKYDQVIDQFHPPEMIDPEVQKPYSEHVAPLSGEIVVAGLGLIDENGNKLLSGVNFRADLKEHVALVGPSNSGKDHLTMMLAGLVPPSSGRVTLGDYDLRSLGQWVTGRRLSYVGDDAYLFSVSVGENLLYGLKHVPQRLSDALDAQARSSEEAERLRAGNIALDIADDWIDYEAAGASGPDDLPERMIEVLRLVDLEEDIYGFGLQGTVDPKARPELAAGLLQARADLSRVLAERGAGDLVVRFDPEKFNDNATLAENLLFGTPIDRAYDVENLPQNPVIVSILQSEGLLDDLEVMAVNIAQTMVEIFADLPPGHPFFDQFSFISYDDLPDFRALITRTEKSGFKSLNEALKARFLALPFRYIKGRHRLDLSEESSESFEARILKARHAIFDSLLTEDGSGPVAFYDPATYNAAASLQDNMLFGRLAFGRAQAAETVGAAMTEVLETLGLRQSVIEVGLDYDVGLAGKRLFQTQRQKLAMARAIIKSPDLLVVNQAFSGMDEATRERVLDRVLAARKGRGVVWALQDIENARFFDRVLVMDGGQVVREGRFEDVAGAAPSDALAETG